MKKVLFVNSFDDHSRHGGTEVMLHHLTQGLARRGIEPVILATKRSSGLERSQQGGVRIWRAGLRNIYWPCQRQRSAPLRALWHLLDSYNVAMQWPLQRVLEQEKPDLVSLHNLSGWSASAWAAVAKMQVPRVQVLHDCYAICVKGTMHRRGRNCDEQCVFCRTLRLPHRALSARVDAVVGVSQWILDRYLSLGYFRGVSARAVIYDAREAGVLGVSMSRKPLRPAVLRFGFIGRVAPIKGIEILLKTFAELGLDTAELCVAGDGDPSFVLALKRRYESARVRFLGRVSPREFYLQVDVVVVPSVWHEPLGMVVAEALAFGRPVIGARRGGIPEMIKHGENGLLFEPDNNGELESALRELEGDRSRRERMARFAEASGRRFLDHEAWVSKYVSLYAKVIANAPG